ncbi:MAG: T9SS type A sorting domain-containing protein [Paludibacter sp.]|nr:T9SS type A sorting domain-containing protein [Paludibacter sp.]
MKNFTKLIILILILPLSVKSVAQCLPYYTTNAGWTESEYYQIIDIDAEKLTGTSLPQHDKSDGTATSSTFGTGSFTTPVMATTDGITYTETSVMWPVNYYMACIAPTFYNSAYTKVNVTGANPSGTATNCTLNDNSFVTSPIWDKKGFIELSRQPSAIADTPPSLHGYIEIDNLPQVERIQWSFSATSYKRGVKCDIDYHDGNGWQPLRWEASNNNSYATFAEQGYQFEELIGNGDDPESLISVRWRIWDGDSIHFDETKTEGVTFTTVNSPYASQQVVRIHQIKIFSGMIPESAPNAVFNPNSNEIQYSISGNTIRFSDEFNVELYNILGKQLLNKKTKSIDISSIDKGIYILRVTDDNGKRLNKKIRL